MKKIVGIMAAAALATSAFAEINVSSWGRMDVIPLNFCGENADGDKEVKSIAGANWDSEKDNAIPNNNVGKDGVSFSGSTENAGMALDIAYAGTGLGVGDNANLWVKPVDMLKLTFGKVDYNNGRQELAYGSFGHSWRFQGLDQGEGGFSVDGRGVSGFVVNLNPIENLWFDYAASVQNDKAYKTLWSNASIGVGYNIPDVAKLRVIVIGKDGKDQKNGSYSTTDGDYGNVGAHAIIQAAADITPVEGLFLTVGTSIPTTFGKAYGVTKGTDESHQLKWYKDAAAAAKDGATDAAGLSASGYYDLKTAATDTKYAQSEVIKASLGATYNVSMLTFHGFFDAKIGAFSGVSAKATGANAGDLENKAFGYAAGLGVDVAFTDSLSLITDARFCNDVYTGKVEDVTTNADGSKDAKYQRGKFGAYVGLCQALTNGFFDVGVEFGCNKTIIQALDNSFTVAIPLQIQVGL